MPLAVRLRNLEIVYLPRGSQVLVALLSKTQGFTRVPSLGPNQDVQRDALTVFVSTPQPLTPARTLAYSTILAI